MMRKSMFVLAIAALLAMGASPAAAAGASDLAIIEASDLTGGPAVVGATHTQTARVLNNGPDSSAKTVVTITASSGQQLITSNSGGYTCTANLFKTALTCALSSPVESNTAPYVFWSVKYTTAGAKTVTVKATGPNSDPNTANNTAVIVTPAASSDLAVSDATDITGGPALAGATHEQGALIWNHGPDFSPTIVVTITATSGQQLSAPGSGCTLNLTRSVLTCSFTDFDSDTAFGVYWYAKYPTAGAKTVTIKVRGPNADPNAANNSGSLTTPVPRSDLAVSDATDTTGGPAQVGATHQQGATIWNHGPDASPTAVVTVTASLGQQLSAAGPGCAVNLGKNVLTCTVANLASGTAFGVSWSVYYATGGAKTVTIKVSGPQADPSSTNNTAVINTAG